MPNKLTEKLAQSKAKIKEKAKKFKPKLVISKLRDGGRVGARRSAWSILGILLYAYFGWSVIEILLLYILLVCKLFVALPFIFKYTPWIQKNMVFLPYVRWPGTVDFDDPQGSCDLPNTRNVYVATEPGVRVGVWHSLPGSYDQQPAAGRAEHAELLLED